MPEPLRVTRDLADAAATDLLGRTLARLLPLPAAGWSVLLAGELGTGKSTLARALLSEVGHEGPVPSPTYTLVEPYEIGENVIYHVDLYRINDAEELPFLGFDELDDGLLLIEWPERAAGLSQRADLRIHLEIAGEGRRATIEALSRRAESIVAAL